MAMSISSDFDTASRRASSEEVKSGLAMKNLMPKPKGPMKSPF